MGQTRSKSRKQSAEGTHSTSRDISRSEVHALSYFRAVFGCENRRRLATERDVILISQAAAEVSGLCLSVSSPSHLICGFHAPGLAQATAAKGRPRCQVRPALRHPWKILALPFPPPSIISLSCPHHRTQKPPSPAERARERDQKERRLRAVMERAQHVSPCNTFR